MRPDHRAACGSTATGSADRSTGGDPAARSSRRSPDTGRAAGPLEAPCRGGSPVWSYGGPAADRIAPRAGHGCTGGVAASRAFDRAAVDVEDVGPGGAACAGGTQVMEPLVRGESEKVAELIAGWGGAGEAIAEAIARQSAAKLMCGPSIQTAATEPVAERAAFEAACSGATWGSEAAAQSASAEPSNTPIETSGPAPFKAATEAAAGANTAAQSTAALKTASKTTSAVEAAAETASAASATATEAASPAETQRQRNQQTRTCRY